MYVLLVSYYILKIELLAETIMQFVNANCNTFIFNLQREEKLASFFLCFARKAINVKI